MTEHNPADFPRLARQIKRSERRKKQRREDADDARRRAARAARVEGEKKWTDYVGGFIFFVLVLVIGAVVLLVTP